MKSLLFLQSSLHSFPLLNIPYGSVVYFLCFIKALFSSIFHTRTNSIPPIFLPLYHLHLLRTLSAVSMLSKMSIILLLQQNFCLLPVVLTLEKR
jgi:hypothetical protein